MSSLPPLMIATAPPIAAVPAHDVRIPASAVLASPAAAKVARRLGATLGVLLAWAAAFLAARSYVEAWSQQAARTTIEPPALVRLP